MAQAWGARVWGLQGGAPLRAAATRLIFRAGAHEGARACVGPVAQGEGGRACRLWAMAKRAREGGYAACVYVWARVPFGLM